ncbi:hypothetical protein NC653_001043 [Populus alba x Populus x berolinensis]|uniref:Uncharacterized protein n=1 Tax=Populus alba x Populus x berolinensis TaxID=444605 RepID=A0AAD6WG24_9ROSI|nr:hypothetical protein NC653_001043 [Populus alba x Populus x berolinensis]
MEDQKPAAWLCHSRKLFWNPLSNLLKLQSQKSVEDKIGGKWLPNLAANTVYAKSIEEDRRERVAGVERLTGTYPILFPWYQYGNFLQDKKQDDTSGTLLKARRVRAVKQHATQLNS